MKKIIALSMVSAFALAFVACGGAKKSETADTTKVTAADTTMHAAPVDTTKKDTATAK